LLISTVTPGGSWSSWTAKQHEWFSDYDAGRSEVLERLGIRVIRFTNDEVCNDLDAELRLPFA
jgi:very-short-patch-repair endonuclease